MAIITKEQILKVLNAYNPCWKTGSANASFAKSYKRFAFFEAMKRLDRTGTHFPVSLHGFISSDINCFAREVLTPSKSESSEIAASAWSVRYSIIIAFCASGFIVTFLSSLFISGNDNMILSGSNTHNSAKNSLPSAGCFCWQCHSFQ